VTEVPLSPKHVRVLVPGLLRSYTEGAATVDLALAPMGDRVQPGGAATLADALAALDARYPGVRFRLVDEQRQVRPHIKMFVDSQLTRDLASPVADGSVLMIVGALSGG
jgi:sulfur-carrier protein